MLLALLANQRFQLFHHRQEFAGDAYHFGGHRVWLGAGFATGVVDGGGHVGSCSNFDDTIIGAIAAIYRLGSHDYLVLIRIKILMHGMVFDPRELLCFRQNRRCLLVRNEAFLAALVLVDQWG